jgi:hypothetical protein
MDFFDWQLNKICEMHGHNELVPIPEDQTFFFLGGGGVYIIIPKTYSFILQAWMCEVDHQPREYYADGYQLDMSGVVRSRQSPQSVRGDGHMQLE